MQIASCFASASYSSTSQFHYQHIMSFRKTRLAFSRDFILLKPKYEQLQCISRTISKMNSALKLLLCTTQIASCFAPASYSTKYVLIWHIIRSNIIHFLILNSRGRLRRLPPKRVTSWDFVRRRSITAHGVEKETSRSRSRLERERRNGSSRFEGDRLSAAFWSSHRSQNGLVQ
jgi:hypothetical protein